MGNVEMITKGQIAKIHVLKSKLGLSDEEYGAALEGYGVWTTKNLNYQQAAELIKRLTKLLPKDMQHSETGKSKKGLKYEELGIRWNEQLKEHYATPKQLRMLEAMWMCSPAVLSKTEDAFLKFVMRISGKGKLEWLMISDVRKIKKAIEVLKPLKQTSDAGGLD